MSWHWPEHQPVFFRNKATIQLICHISLSIVFVPLVKAKPVWVFCSQPHLSCRLRFLPSCPSISSCFLLHCSPAPSYSSCHMSDLLRSFFTLAHNKGHQLSLSACAGRRSLSTSTRGKAKCFNPTSTQSALWSHRVGREAVTGWWKFGWRHTFELKTNLKNFT